MTDYNSVNGAWPDNLPTITQKESRAFAIRLNKAFQRKYGRVVDLPSSWLRSRSWASTEETRNQLTSGWRRMVHDVSHHVHDVIHNGKLKNHSGVHAELEFSMIKYVIEKGWLEKSQSVVMTRDDKLNEAKSRLETRLVNWNSKLSRAENAIKKLKKKLKGLERGRIPR